ncbi:PrpF protein [Echria macrotheca]|uniref:PrpF protein n=1 Tax=Echria macrotheca TaxID=438768 RepID=A0AAJ0BDC2_9PEZI|nr:PrpF protein [Echria macrotheca]
MHPSLRRSLTKQNVVSSKIPRQAHHLIDINNNPPHFFHHSRRKMNSSTSSQLRSIPAIFARGGTSKGLLIQRHHLPLSPSKWQPILAAAMGSPDLYGRQLDGMGSGISSTSKICVLSESTRPEVADVDFTFVQVGVNDGKLDMAGNCGNMLAAVGPVAFDEGILSEPVVVEDDGRRETTVRIFNTNTGKVIHSRFEVAGDPPKYCPVGEYEMDGVPGRGSKIVLSFVEPAGAKTGRALPTGRGVDVLTLPDGGKIEASLVDVSNPGVFVRVSDLGLDGTLDPGRVEGDSGLKAHLENIRRAGAAKMGLDPDVESVPKIVLVFSPGGEEDIRCLALSMGQAHKAVPLTLALCLGAATRIPGTVPYELARRSDDKDVVTIGHPSGRIQVGTTVRDGEIVSAELHRTARVLMKGEVFY